MGTVLINPTDRKKLALTLNARKKKLSQADFQQTAQRAGAGAKVSKSMFTNRN
jgi:hypothetical protein